MVCKEYILPFRLIIYILYSFTRVFSTFYIGLLIIRTMDQGCVQGTSPRHRGEMWVASLSSVSTCVSALTLVRSRSDSLTRLIAE